MGEKIIDVELGKILTRHVSVNQSLASWSLSFPIWVITKHCCVDWRRHRPPGPFGAILLRWLRERITSCISLSLFCQNSPLCHGKGGFLCVRAETRCAGRRKIEDWAGIAFGSFWEDIYCMRNFLDALEIQIYHTKQEVKINHEFIHQVVLALGASYLPSSLLTPWS